MTFRNPGVEPDPTHEVRALIDLHSLDPYLKRGYGGDPDVWLVRFSPRSLATRELPVDATYEQWHALVMKYAR